MDNHKQLWVKPLDFKHNYAKSYDVICVIRDTGGGVLLVEGPNGVKYPIREELTTDQQPAHLSNPLPPAPIKPIDFFPPVPVMEDRITRPSNESTATPIINQPAKAKTKKAKPASTQISLL